MRLPPHSCAGLETARPRTLAHGSLPLPDSKPSARREVRAKAKIREARIPLEVPSPAELPERLNTVLQVIYLVFNEGYSASFGESVTRADLSSEAIRLGRLLNELIPEPEVTGLLALMLLHESRRAATTSPERNVISLEAQDLPLSHRPLIDEE